MGAGAGAGTSTSILFDEMAELDEDTAVALAGEKWTEDVAIRFRESLLAEGTSSLKVERVKVLFPELFPQKDDNPPPPPDRDSGDMAQHGSPHIGAPTHVHDDPTRSPGSGMKSALSNLKTKMTKRKSGKTSLSPDSSPNTNSNPNPNSNEQGEAGRKESGHLLASELPSYTRVGVKSNSQWLLENL